LCVYTIVPVCICTRYRLRNCTIGCVTRAVITKTYERCRPRDHAHAVDKRTASASISTFIILINKSRPDDHGSRRSDITQRLFQRAPDRLGILPLGDETSEPERRLPCYRVGAKRKLIISLRMTRGLEISRVWDSVGFSPVSGSISRVVVVSETKMTVVLFGPPWNTRIIARRGLVDRGCVACRVNFVPSRRRAPRVQSRGWIRGVCETRKCSCII